MRVSFVCVNVGPLYGMEYVSILRDMVMRNCTQFEGDVAFWCVTDRPDELPEGVYAIPADPALPGYWQKLRLFSPDMPWPEGERVVYFDLDVCITGRLEDLIETKGIALDTGWPCYNSSVMVWDHGEHRDAWDRFTPDIITRSPGFIVPKENLPAGAPNGGDQEFLTEVGGWAHLPHGWVVSYRWQAQAWPPNGSKVVQFHGQPKPADVAIGWVPNVWKAGGFTSLPEFKGVNTEEDVRLEHVRINSQRDLPWFSGFPPHKQAIAIVCGAPSMRDSLPQIRAQKRRGARICSVNNAWRFLVENGVAPDVHIMLDARRENVEFIAGMPKSMRLLLASQCHPDVFDAAIAEGLDVVVWHNRWDSGEDSLRDILAPWWDGPNQKPIIGIPGGCTVGLRSLWLATFSGFRTIHLYGIDSSYADDGTHHAYPQALNDHETIIPVVRGDKTYRCAPWMVRQSAEFQETWRDLATYADPDTGRPDPVTVHVHGSGLIPDIARDLKRTARAA